MRVRVSSLVVLAVSCCLSAQASNLDAATVRKLAQIEQKYFGQSYNADSDEHRTERVEKLIFGEPGTGSLEQRIAKISATANAAANDVNPIDSDSSQTIEQAHSVAPMTPTVKTPSKSGSAVTEAYPHVTELENSILGQNFPSQDLAVRLARMEKKAFGNASASSDLSQRTDALEQYAEKNLHKKDFYEDTTETATTTGGAASDSSAADYPRITALEKVILMQSHAGEPLPERLNRMEAKAFGSPSEKLDLSQRTDALEKYAEKTLHKKPLVDPEQSDYEVARGAAGGAQPRGSTANLLAKVGNSLLGMAGMGMGPGGMGLGSGPIAGIMGAGGASGFGGVRVRSRQSVQEEQDKDSSDDLADANREEPSIHASVPPPSDAKLLTKVGWCEVQVFGHTFSTMHLPQRLQQLNGELNFEPGKSNMQLMDDVPLMIKAVVASKTSGKSIGSALKPAVPVR